MGRIRWIVLTQYLFSLTRFGGMVASTETVCANEGMREGIE